jgi:hypothetical protein
MDRRVMIMCDTRASGITAELADSYFVRVERRPSGGVTVLWTDERDQAMVFEDAASAAEFCRDSPLEMFVVSFVPAPARDGDDELVSVACLGLADGSSAGELDGAWLVSYDPAGCDGRGDATWSGHPADAARFTPLEWAELWTASPPNRPLRPDGKPNRPITMFHLMIVPAYPGRLPSILPPGC